MHDICILVGGVNGRVVAPYCVIAVGIVVSECGRLEVSRLGHDILSEMLVECRNGTIQRYWYVW